MHGQACAYSRPVSPPLRPATLPVNVAGLDLDGSAKPGPAQDHHRDALSRTRARRVSHFRQNATSTHLDTTPTEPGRHRTPVRYDTKVPCFAAIALAGQTATSADVDSRPNPSLCCSNAMAEPARCSAPPDLRARMICGSTSTPRDPRYAWRRRRRAGHLDAATRVGRSSLTPVSCARLCGGLVSGSARPVRARRLRRRGLAGHSGRSRGSRSRCRL
jgi:hypothetical protein